MNLSPIDGHLWFLEALKFCYFFCCFRIPGLFLYVIDRRLFLALSLNHSNFF